VQVLDMFHSNV